MGFRQAVTIAAAFGGAFTAFVGGGGVGGIVAGALVAALFGRVIVTLRPIDPIFGPHQ